MESVKKMKRWELEKRIREYILSDIHRLEDYSDIEICCEADRDKAYAQMLIKLRASDMGTLQEFVNAILEDRVTYRKHGCR